MLRFTRDPTVPIIPQKYSSHGKSVADSVRFDEISFVPTLVSSLDKPVDVGIGERRHFQHTRGAGRCFRSPLALLLSYFCCHHLFGVAII